MNGQPGSEYASSMEELFWKTSQNIQETMSNKNVFY